MASNILHSTVEVCWNNNISYFIWINLCAESLDKWLPGGPGSGPVWGWSIPPTAHSWLHCKFFLSVQTILFKLTRISNNV